MSRKPLQVRKLYPMFRGSLYRAMAGVAMVSLFSSCVYFNTYYNAEKAYAQALRMRDKRQDKNPEDTVSLVAEEKLKLERAITKCSKVLELFPEKLKYAPKALFLMGESYLLMAEYSRAVQKYEELARYYPKAEELPLAEVHRAKGLFLGGQELKARAAVEDILNKNPQGVARREVLILAAAMEVSGKSKTAALALYEKFLSEKGMSNAERSEALWQSALLAYDLELWEKARNYALDPLRKSLATRLQYRNEKLALQCLYRQGRFAQGMTEVREMIRHKAYTLFRPELKLFLAQGFAGLGDWASAEKLYREIPALSPRSDVAAEAYYRLGERFLAGRIEDSARIYFDSAAAAGEFHEYGALGKEKGSALARLAELRKSPPPDSSQPHSQDFMIAELFLFRLVQVDSALERLDFIVADTAKRDTVNAMRAAYARAFIHEEFRQDTAQADSLYRFVLKNYPGTEWAKQAEKNLGLKPTVETGEDKAHTLFLMAEELRFGGEDLNARVIPAYREVARLYPKSQHAAKAVFVIAFIQEDLSHRDSSQAGSIDSAKAAYQFVRKNYPGTPYAVVAEAKLTAVGAAAAATALPVSSQPAAAVPAAVVPESRSYHQISAPEQPQLSGSVPADTAEETVKPHKEEFETNYENVDQY